MTIPYRIVIEDELTAAQKAHLDNEIYITFSRINNIFNNWNPQSELSRINSAKANIKIPLSQEFYSYLQKISKLVQFTEGRFDPTISPLKRLWLANLKQNTIPQKNEIDTILEYIGFEKIHITDDCCIIKNHDKVEMDLCGSVKGFAVDNLYDALSNMNLCNFYIEWGGEIKTSGTHKNGNEWKIHIFGSDKIINISNCSIASSGSYAQAWTVNLNTFSHIINPKTKIPIMVTNNSITSSSVIMPNCYEADAIATALMTFESIEDAIKWSYQHNIQSYVN